MTTAKARKTVKAKARTIAEQIEDPQILEILQQPVGTPVNLTREQALAIVRAGIGGRPDLPSGKEYVRRVRKAGSAPARG
jgi:hypothetical protein